MLCTNNAKNEAAVIATSEAEFKEKDQQCIGRRIFEVSVSVLPRREKKFLSAGLQHFLIS